MKTKIDRTCYLCGNVISSSEKVTKDHVISKAIIDRAQPKQKGYRYLGWLPTHEACNNEFWREIYVRKALFLMEMLLNPDVCHQFKMKEIPGKTLVTITVDDQLTFSRKELKYFHITDVRTLNYNEWTDSNFINKLQAGIVFEKPINTALSVLAKNAAAVLVKDFNISPATRNWRIFTMLNTYNNEVDLSSFLGHPIMIDQEIHLYCKKFINTKDIFLVYAYHSIIIYFFFAFDRGYQNINLFKKSYNSQNQLLFEKSFLNELKDFDWLAHDIYNLILPEYY